MTHLIRKKVQKQMQITETPLTSFKYTYTTDYIHVYVQSSTPNADLRKKIVGYVIKTYLLLFIYTKSILILTTNDDVINL